MAGVVFEWLKDISDPDAVVTLEERTYNSKYLFFSIFIFLLQLIFPYWSYWGTEAQDGCDPTAPDLMYLCPAFGLWKEGGQVHILPTDQPLLCDLTSLYSCDSWMWIYSMFGYGAHTKQHQLYFAPANLHMCINKDLIHLFLKESLGKCGLKIWKLKENSARKLNCRVVLLHLKGEFRDKWSMNFMLILQNTLINWSTEYIQIRNITVSHLKVGGFILLNSHPLQGFCILCLR